MEPIIALEAVTKKFGDFIAVDNISFNLKLGDVLGFLGPNGAGKSTTMKMITGFLLPNSGSIKIQGLDINHYPIACKQKIGYLPEGAPLYQDMTPLEFLHFVADIRQMQSPHKEQRIEEVIGLINLEEVRDQPIETLSKGFKRRVGLAQAILHDPEILILDEPTDGLDPNQKHEVRALIQRMAKTKAIILSTHVLEEVDSLCNRVIIIAGGKIVADGTPADLERQAPSYGAITVTVAGAKADHVQDTLRTMHRVHKFEILIQNDQSAQFRIFPEKGQNLVHDLNMLSQNHNWDISEMFIDRGRLEETFRAMTADKQERT